MTCRKSLAIFAVAVVGAWGCAARPKPAVKPLEPVPIEERTLAMLQAAATLPASNVPTTAPAPVESLQLYAQGRDALLAGEKARAVEKLKAALAIDPWSAIVHRDLAYAYLGNDNTLALQSFQEMLAIDPDDGNARLQLARLLIEKKQIESAIRQLQLASLTSTANNKGFTAVVNLLLGELLESTGYRRAALGAYEKVIVDLDYGGASLRGRPELAELIARPAALMLRTADLAVACKEIAKATALYQRIAQLEPQAAGLIELRIARAEIAAGNIDAGTQRALRIVDRYHGSRTVVRAFVELFADRGGAAEALRRLGKSSPSTSDPSRLLRAELQLSLRNAPAALDEIRYIEHLDINAVRTLVHASLAAGRKDALVTDLLTRTAAHPEDWPALSHGWAILTQSAQAEPLTAVAVRSLVVPSGTEAVRQFLLSVLYRDAGQPVSARTALELAKQLDANLVTALSKSPDSDPPIDLGFTSSAELAGLLGELSDDPSLIELAVTNVIRNREPRVLQEALQAACAKSPANVVLASVYVQVLTADRQTAEASSVLERAMNAVTSAPQFYFLASQFNAIGDPKSAELALRKGLEKDANSASVCNDLGFLLADEGRELDFAHKLVSRAADLEPDNPAYLDSLGWVYYKRSDFTQATQYLQRAIALCDPADPTVLDHAGDAKYRDNKLDQARDSWRLAIEALRQRSSADAQLRLRLESKLRQLDAKQTVDVAPVVSK